MKRKELKKPPDAGELSEQNFFVVFAMACFGREEEDDAHWPNLSAS